MNLMDLLLETERFSQDIKMIFIREYQKIIDKYELTAKQSVIINFVHQREKPTMGEIATMIGATTSAASQFVKRLENLHYLKREVNVQNRRETFVVLAENGHRFFEEMKQVDKFVLEKYFLKLPDEDIIEYHRILKSLHTIVTGASNE